MKLSKMILINGAKYKHKETKEIWELRRDYDGERWYMSKIEEGGRAKTLSVSADEMREALRKHYEKE